jgi:lipid-binding SYLF domain-containing protein
MRISRKIAAVLACTIAVSAHAGDNRADKQKKIRKMAQETLQRLYSARPSAKAAIQRAAGYAVFSDLGVKILLAGSGKGHGLAVNNATKQETFMKMLELQAGLGVGVDKFRIVFVFDTQDAFDKFINSGWEFGEQATLAAKSDDKGKSLAGAASVSDGVWMYQLTDQGLAAEITVKSSKYSKDDDLN